MFTVGEFSKIAQVPASLLRYYDRIDLFTPESVDEWTGYRRYSAQQLPTLNRILALKELGLSLEQIARLLRDDVPADEIRGMFTLKRAQVEQQVQEEIARLRTIESRLRHIDAEGDMQEMDVVVKSIPAQRFLSLRKTCADVFDALPLVAEMHRLLPEKVGAKAIGHMIVIMHGDSFAVENVDVEIGFPYLRQEEITVPLTSGATMAVRELEPMETAATSMRLGVFENGCLSYGAIGTWVEANGYQFNGPAREVFLQPPLPGRDDETVVEIQFPVERVETPQFLP